MAKATGNRKNSKDRLPSQIPVPSQVEDEEEHDDETVNIEGEETVVDKLVEDLQSARGLKSDNVGLAQQNLALQKIVTSQNNELKGLKEQIARLNQARAFTVEDEQRLHSIFAEISFDRGHHGLTVTIAGQRSHKFRVTSPTLFEALKAFRESRTLHVQGPRA